MTETHQGALLHDGGLLTLSPGMINPNYDMSIYNYDFNYLIRNILILPPTCLALHILANLFGE